MKTSANVRKNKSGNLFVKFAFYFLMKLLKVQRYSAKHKKVWDDFVSEVELHSILFYRDYMEYHSDRFTDYSLMVHKDQKLIAIMPANIDENVQKEERELSKLLNSSEDELKIEMGNPDRIIFKEGNRNRFYVYKSEKFKIKCERIFEIDQNDLVIGFTSKNCF